MPKINNPIKKKKKYTCAEVTILPKKTPKTIKFEKSNVSLKPTHAEVTIPLKEKKRVVQAKFKIDDRVIVYDAKHHKATMKSLQQ